ncbi:MULTISPECIES: aldehyde dehydrogenase family protein [unclassified Roseitalea]|uniref:aldehyde dehydrogenase family protein n=1 Tax=unclassified Roseitalea TaxID=2639107 RepID=UPI0027402659|nr:MULTISPECIES: aldehyde dehydrogenase family protein [unclassified Roseitalea]
MSATHGLCIDGDHLTGGGRETLPVVNPATGQAGAAMVCATTDDLDAAAEAARRAHADWSRSAPSDRAALLRAMADRVDASLETIARLITTEQGKPLAEAVDELNGVAANLRYHAGVAETFPFHTVVSGPAERHIFETGKGPVLIINTWNFPVETVVSHMAPSLAAGCPSVVLANGDAPGSVCAFFHAISDIDMPRGLVNLVMGHAADISQHLIGHPAIAHLSYTGSITVGRALAAQAGGEIKRATLELGGLAPALVLPGADIDEAARAFGWKRFWNAGQICTAPNRIYVNRDQYAPFVDAVAAYAESLVVGDGMDPATTMGPLASERRVAFMQHIVTDALARGARFVTGQKEAGNRGFFWKPTVLADVPEDARGMREEVFGPVALVRPYDDLATVIATVNDCDIGLSAYVYGPDADEAFVVARRIEAGSVGVNQMTTAFPDTPFGGIKHSGMGTIGGPSALREYLFPRSIAAPAGVIGHHGARGS